MSVCVEGASVHGGDEDGGGSGGAGLGDVFKEESLVVFKGDGGLVGLGIDFLVVVVELEEEVVAWLDEGEDLLEALFSDEALDGFSGFCVVGDDDAGVEEAGEHLSPGGPRFDVLIDDGGVSGEVDGGFLNGGDGDGPDGGVVAVEFEGELGVPVEVADFAGLEFDAVGFRAGDFGDAEVGVKGAGDAAFAWGGDFFEHEAASFGADGGGGSLWATEDYGDSVAAFREGDGEEEGLVAGAGFSGDSGGSAEIEAGGGAGVEGCGGEAGGVVGGAAGEGLGESGDCGGEGEEEKCVAEGDAWHVGLRWFRNNFSRRRLAFLRMSLLWRES